MPNDEIDTLAGRLQCLPRPHLDIGKEGRKVCTVCGEPVIRANYGQATHVDCRVQTHAAKS